MPSTPDSNREQDRTLRAIQQLTDAMDHMHGTMNQQMGLNASDLRALRAMSIKQLRGDEVTPYGLSVHLSMSTAATTALIRRLVDHGFLHRRPHPTDRRSQILTLTDSARATFHQHFDQHLQTMQAVIAEYPAGQLETITQFLDHLSHQLYHSAAR